MRIAVCDDDEQDLCYLSALLTELDPSMQISRFSTALALYESAEQEMYDAVFLDIEMQAPNGYEIALRLSRQASHPIILFVTNSAAYAVQGYGLALRYLLKPLTAEALREALDALRQELSNNRLAINLGGIAHVLQVQDILYVETANHHVVFHTVEGVRTFRVTLRELSRQLPARWFCAPHQSFMVNLLHVQTTSAQEVCLTDGTRIPITRSKQREFLRSFHRFLGV